ncbi:MAG TPA: SAM-dependent methyltransferase [Myxococcota bacterium]|nr:SAM-dependent methyltransferase [Myxococcota bacterium]
MDKRIDLFASVKQKTCMEKDRPSATAQGAAVVRTLHQILDDEPRILDDTIAARLVREELERHKRMIRLFAPRGLRANLAMRSRYAEDCLAESLGDGVGQYVLLGAGLDTFAYRQPAWARSLRIFEVDHPATQKWKRAKLAAAEISIPANVTLVPLDFERTSLKEGLAAGGLDFRIPTFFSSLGVTQYLTEEALDLSLNFVLSLPPASEIVFSFVLAASALSWWERAFAAVFAVIVGVRGGEPWLSRFSPEQLANKLTSMGFSKVIHFSTDAANARYFRARRDGLKASKLEQMMRAIV